MPKSKNWIQLSWNIFRQFWFLTCPNIWNRRETITSIILSNRLINTDDIAFASTMTSVDNFDCEFKLDCIWRCEYIWFIKGIDVCVIDGQSSSSWSSWWSRALGLTLLLLGRQRMQPVIVRRLAVSHRPSIGDYYNFTFPRSFHNSNAGIHSSVIFTAQYCSPAIIAGDSD